jgi:hypothetical protein
VKILFTMGSPEYLRFFDETIRELAARGHVVAIAVNHQKDAKPARLEGLADCGDRVVNAGIVPPRGDAWTDLAKAVRGTMDFVRYLDPAFAEAPALRARMKRKALPRRLQSLDRISALEPAAVRRWLSRLATIESAIPSSPEVERFIRDLAPDAVLVSPLVDAASDQVDTIKSARALGIPTIVCIASWDNLTNKGLLRIQPDRVILWNEAQKREAVTMHGVPPQIVTVTGAQPFDRWFGREPRRSREEFGRRVGLPGADPFVLFVGSSMFISAADAEIAFVRRWIEAIRQSSSARIRDLPILVRPHPYNGGAWADVDLSGLGRVAVWPRGRHNPVDEANRDDYFESLHYSLAVVGINTSAMIEAAIVGRPVLSILTSDFARTQEGTLHFRHLLPEHGGFLRVASSLDEHLAQLEETVLHPERVEAQIRGFVRSFIRPHGLDRPCVGMLADAIQAGAAAHPRPGAATVGQRLLRVALYPMRPMAVVARSKRSGAEIVQTYVQRPAREVLIASRKQIRRAGRDAILRPARAGAKAVQSWRRIVGRGAGHLLRAAASRARRLRYGVAVAVKGRPHDGAFRPRASDAPPPAAAKNERVG